MLHLTIATPETTVVDAVPIKALRAADDTGSFGVLPGHADLLTALSPTVLRWRTADDALHYCAVRGGILTVSGGNRVAVACRSAQTSDRLDALEADVRAARAAGEDEDRRARIAQMQAHTRAIRQLMRYLEPGGSDDIGDILAEPRA